MDNGVQEFLNILNWSNRWNIFHFLFMYPSGKENTESVWKGEVNLGW